MFSCSKLTQVNTPSKNLGYVCILNILQFGCWPMAHPFHCGNLIEGSYISVIFYVQNYLCTFLKICFLETDGQETGRPQTSWGGLWVVQSKKSVVGVLYVLSDPIWGAVSFHSIDFAPITLCPDFRLSNINSQFVSNCSSWDSFIHTSNSSQML